MGRYKSSCKKVVRQFERSVDVYQHILETTNARGRSSLENLKKICDLLEDSGVDLSIAAVAREAARLDVSPKEDALRNNPKLYSYVILRQAESKLKPRVMVKDQYLEEVVKQLRQENLVLREFIRKMEIK